jgi:hypothetical protein
MQNLLRTLLLFGAEILGRVETWADKVYVTRARRDAYASLVELYSYPAQRRAARIVATRIGAAPGWHVGLPEGRRSVVWLKYHDSSVSWCSSAVELELLAKTY